MRWRAPRPSEATIDCSRLLHLLMLGNLCLWIYFWISFATVAYPFRKDPLGHPAGTGFTFWSHSIAVTESPFVHPFFKVAFVVNFPCFAIVLPSGHALLPADVFFIGISEDGWLLLIVMVASFVQWYAIASFLQLFRLRYRFVPSASIFTEAVESAPTLRSIEAERRE